VVAFLRCSGEESAAVVHRAALRFFEPLKIAFSKNKNGNRRRRHIFTHFFR
jgi:hypothetical protein